MSGIPEDIRIEAANALNATENMAGSLFSERVDIIAMAILLEREACAKIAEARAVEYDNSYETSEFKSQALAGAAALHVMAEAIRRR